MVDDLFIPQVQLYQIVVAFPALIPEAVIVIGVSSKINVEPVKIGRILPVLQHILKGPEASSHMVKHPVQNHADSFLMKPGANLLKILIRAKAAVHLPEIPCIVSMGIGFKQGGKIYGICPQLSDMSDPVNHLPYSRSLRRLLCPVVFKRRSAEAQRIYLVKNAFVSPHRCVLLFSSFQGNPQKSPQ